MHNWEAANAKKDDDVGLVPSVVLPSSWQPPPPSSHPPLHHVSPSSEHCSADEEGPVEFGDLPVHCRCRFCHREVTTTVEFQASWVTYLLSCFVFLLLGWLTICVLPFVWPLLQDTRHFCPQCLNLIARRQRISLPSVRNDIVTVRCGSCALVLSRKYVCACGVMLTLILVFFGGRWYVKNVGIPDIAKGEPTTKTWEEFLEHCGFHSYLGNPLHAMKAFDKDYALRTVSWQGRVNRIHEGIFAKNFLYVDMEPSQYRRGDMADLALLFGRGLNEKVADMQVGDLVAFEATLVELGTRGRPHLAVLWDAELKTKAAELPPIQVDTPNMMLMRRGLGPGGVMPIQRLPELARHIQDFRKEMIEQRKQLGEGKQRVVILPFGDGNFPIRVFADDESSDEHQAEKEGEGSTKKSDGEVKKEEGLRTGEDRAALEKIEKREKQEEKGGGQPDPLGELQGL